jgi:hypothetical protein
MKSNWFRHLLSDFNCRPAQSCRTSLRARRVVSDKENANYFHIVLGRVNTKMLSKDKSQQWLWEENSLERGHKPLPLAVFGLRLCVRAKRRRQEHDGTRSSAACGRCKVHQVSTKEEKKQNNNKDDVSVSPFARLVGSFYSERTEYRKKNTFHG